MKNFALSLAIIFTITALIFSGSNIFAIDYCDNCGLDENAQHYVYNYSVSHK